MATALPNVTPKHLWVVGILSLLWNAFGAFDYTMTELKGAAYLESVGFGADEIAYFTSFPAWAVALWAIGVWSSLVGSILLLMRSRHAPKVFLLSIAGAIASFAYQYMADKPASLETGMMAAMPIVIVILIVAQWYYASRMAAAGVLR